METLFDEKYNLFIFGGLGDVSLTRKIPLFYNTDLASEILVRGIFDVYSPREFTNVTSARKVFWEIAQKRLKGTLDEKTKERLVNDLVSGRTAYFSSSDSVSFQNGLEQVRRFGDHAIVDISTPNNTHFKYLEDAVYKTNAHILIEKPVVSSRGELGDLARLLQKTNLGFGSRALMDSAHYSHYGQVRDYFSNFDNYSSGEGFGKIKKMLIHIKEMEGFENQRNRDIINRNISGGGIWMDLGIHAMSFISFLGGNISPDSIRASSEKCSEKIISGEEYGETSMRVKLNVFGENFLNDVSVDIMVGKKLSQKRKKILIEHESGHCVDLDFDKRKIAIYLPTGGEPIMEKVYTEDAFYFVFKDFLECINTHKNLHNFSASMQALENVFSVYDHTSCNH